MRLEQHPQHSFVAYLPRHPDGTLHFRRMMRVVRDDRNAIRIAQNLEPPVRKRRDYRRQRLGDPADIMSAPKGDLDRSPGVDPVVRGKSGNCGL